MAKGKKTGGRTAKPATVTNMRLLDDVRSLAEIVGNGDRTAGVEKLFAQLPLIHRVKQYLESLDDPIAESLVVELEDLEIDRIYKEAIAEGVIVVCNPGGKSSVWIV